MATAQQLVPAIFVALPWQRLGGRASAAVWQRVRRVGPSGTTLYTYDESGHLLGEYDGSGALIQETVWLGDIPVATLRSNGATVDVYYVHTDHLSTPRLVTQPSNNAARWRWDSDPFGTNPPNADPSGLGAFVYSLRFPGQQYDGLAGLYYNYFRDYDAATGRYVESDPIGLDGGINTYTYVGGRVTRFVDPLGLQAHACRTVGCRGLCLRAYNIRLEENARNYLDAKSECVWITDTSGFTRGTCEIAEASGIRVQDRTARRERDKCLEKCRLKSQLEESP